MTSVEGWLQFRCTTPDCGYSTWLPAVFDPDGPAREATVRAADHGPCPRCGCRTIPDWHTGPRIDAPQTTSP
jgi:hypothetical protein